MVIDMLFKEEPSENVKGKKVTYHYALPAAAHALRLEQNFTSKSDRGYQMLLLTDPTLTHTCFTLKSAVSVSLCYLRTGFLFPFPPC